MMRRAAKPALALVVGCRVCGVTRPGMLALSAGDMVCRPCAARLGAFIRKANGDWLAELWSTQRAPSLPRYEGPVPAGEVVFDDPEEVRPEHLQAHHDLAAAYVAMGLAIDALRVASVALEEWVGHDWAQTVFNWMFDKRHARPDALARLVSALRIS